MSSEHLRWPTLGVMLCATVEAQGKLAKNPPSIPDLQTAIKSDPGNPKLHVALGLAYWDHNDYPHAFESFQRAVKVGPSSAEAHNWLGVAIMEKADLAGAITEFKKAVSLDPKYARAYTNLGSALAKSGELNDAVQAFQKALALEPDNLAAHMNLGVALREKGDAQGALTHLRRVAASDPDNAAVQYEFGQTLRQTGDLVAAQTSFEKALEVNPELQEGYYALGAILKQESAARPKPAPLPVSPADDLLAARQGSHCARRSELREKPTSSKPVRADEKNADAQSLLGFVLGQQGDLPAALEHLERSVALRPDSAENSLPSGRGVVVQRRKGSSDRTNCERAFGWIRLPARVRLSWAPLCARRANWPTLVSACSARLRCFRRSQRRTSILAPFSRELVNLNKALGQFETGLNSSSAAPTPDWNSAIAALREAISRNNSKCGGS